MQPAICECTSKGTYFQYECVTISKPYVESYNINAIEILALRNND